MTNIYEILSAKFGNGHRDATKWIQFCINNAMPLKKGKHLISGTYLINETIYFQSNKR